MKRWSRTWITNISPRSCKGIAKIIGKLKVVSTLGCILYVGIWRQNIAKTCPEISARHKHKNQQLLIFSPFPLFWTRASDQLRSISFSWHIILPLSTLKINIVASPTSPGRKKIQTYNVFRVLCLFNMRRQLLATETFHGKRLILPDPCVYCTV